MPSPVGHALGGFIAGWLVAGPPLPGTGAAGANRTGAAARQVRQALAFAAIGLVADLDLLIGRHSQFTHSIGAVLFVLGVAAWALHGRARWIVLALAAGAAYASHPLLDWLARDGTPPRGIMALWPLTREYYLSHADIFWGISREPWRPGVLWHNTVAIAREIGLLAPLAALTWWLRRRPPATAAQNVPFGAAANRQRLRRATDATRRGESARSD